MRFYIDKIPNNNSSAIYDISKEILFISNGYEHNTKNASYIKNNGYKFFSLNGKCYGDEDDFTKQSWRRFVKMEAFL
jgi:hypothetical protein